MSNIKKTKQNVETKKEPKETIKAPWGRDREKILTHYSVSKEEGLAANEVEKRNQHFGFNKLREVEKESSWKILAEQFKSLLVGLLSVATIVSFIFGEWIEGTAILAVLLINAGIGFYTEIRAVRSMEALRELTRVDAKVLRNGEVKKINAKNLVPGDIVLLESGDIIPADLRIIEASRLKVDESTLTGESVPVRKETEKIEDDAPLAERKNMLYKGTFLTRGSAKGIVTTTGMETELGQISAFIEEAEEEETPLEKRLDKLAQKLIPLLLIIAGIVAVAGIIQGRGIFIMIETAIALAVATVPEGLPIVATIALARGMWRMAEENALVNRLSSVETLGSTSVICTDKTGTLTENKMTVDKYSLAERDFDVSSAGSDTDRKFSSSGEDIDLEKEKDLKKAIEVGVLCNNASYSKGEDGEKNIVGDPMEVSLLISGLKADMDRNEILENKPEVREISFDPSVKMMATYHEIEEGYQVAVKGAPESVIEASSSIQTKNGEEKLDSKDKKKWLRKNEEMAESGLRVLALATKNVKNSETEPYKNLTFLGLVAMLDPPRENVKEAIKKCQNAGIKVVMVTGDHAKTARKIAYEVGLVEEEKSAVVEGSELEDGENLSDDEKKRFSETSIFARVAPKQKLNLIEIHQEKESIVAMTGDGVNDAPALKKADIGVAMGERGTQVAREAADMILQDDNFSTISKAVEQGRVIYRNIRKFVLYLLSCNLSEIIVVFLASLMNYPLPILPLQILFLNVVTDIFPAFALGVGEGGRDIMEKPPRDPKEPILTRKHWSGISLYGILISIAVFSSFLIGAEWFGMYINGDPNAKVVTISFLTLAFAQLWHVFNMRDRGSKFLKNDVTLNKWVWIALGLCTVLLILATYLPGLSDILNTINPGVRGWALVIGMSLAPWAVGQIWNQIAPTSREKVL